MTRPETPEEQREWLFSRASRLETLLGLDWLPGEVERLWDNPREFHENGLYDNDRVPDSDDAAYMLFHYGVAFGIAYEQQFPEADYPWDDDPDTDRDSGQYESRVFIHGASDDLIVVEGAVTKELYANYGEDTVIKFNDGATFTLTFDGVWRIDCRHTGDQLAPGVESEASVFREGMMSSFPEYSEVAVYRTTADLTDVEVVDDD